MPPISLKRRHFLALTGGAVGALALPPFDAEAAELDPAPFTLGVASGDPDDTSVVLWTRLAPDPFDATTGGMSADPVEVRWQLAKDDRFRYVIASGKVSAEAASAHSVHVVVEDLPPNQWFYYRFTAQGVTSRTGRTRTLPAPGFKADHVRFAFVSCQSWVGGAYSAYRDLAQQDLDFVVHLGDYIYETSNGSIEEFRRLHAQYKTAPQLRDAHARFPWFLTWDDHEVQNNYAGDVAGGAGDGRPFLERRANGYQAYYEHLPMRPEQRPNGPDALMYRRTTFGRLAEFSILDTRQYRSDQALGDGRKEPSGEVYDPSRTLTGPAQEQWLLDGLAASQASWNVIAQQTIMAQFDYDLGPGKIVNLDQWDGYPPARSRILDFIAEHQPANPVVLSGDWHTHWVNDLKTDFDDPASPVVATEFVGTSISSGAGWDADVRLGLPANPHVRFYNGSYRGYVLCDVTPERWRSDLRIVLKPGDPASPAYTIAAFEVLDGQPGARRIAGVGDGLSGRVTDRATGDPLLNVEVSVTDANGLTLVTTWTDPDGEFVTFVPPGDYTVEANGVGYDVERGSTTLPAKGGATFDVSLRRSTARAQTGRIVPGPQSEGTADDITLANDMVAISISAGSNDSQLSGVTVGKPRDLAAVGHLDQLDWANLPYASATQPRGGSAWQQRTVRSTTMEIVSDTVARATGASVPFPDVTVVTDFEIRQGEPWVTATTVFTNTGATEHTLWVGDVLDHDGTGQRSGVPGAGTITASAPADFTPTEPWIGMTGSDRQTYGLLYDEGGFGVYACGIWAMTQRQIRLAPGAAFTMRRRIAAVDSGNGDPFAVLSDL